MTVAARQVATLALALAARAGAQATLEVSLRADPALNGPPALVWARQQLPRLLPASDVRAALRLRVAADGVHAEPGEASLPANTYLAGRVVLAHGAQWTVHCDDSGFETWRGPRTAFADCAEVQPLLSRADLLRGAGTAWVHLAALVGLGAAGIETESPTGLLLSLGAAECGDLLLRQRAAGDDWVIEGRSRGGLAFPALLLALAQARPASTGDEEQRWIALAYAARDSRREEAAMQLARYGSGASARCLRALLHADDGARLRAIEALARRRATDAVPAILAAARGDAESTPIAAAALAALWPECSAAEREAARARAADDAALRAAIAHGEHSVRIAGLGATAAPSPAHAPAAGARNWVACALALTALAVAFRVLAGAQRIS